MTTIEELAQTIQQAHGIDSHTAALDVVRVTVDQIADDPDLYDTEAQQLTVEGVEIVVTSIAQSYAQGLHGTVAQQLLTEISDKVAEIVAGIEVHNAKVAERDELVRAALRTELPREAIMTAAGVTKARLYQIRDGRR